MRQVRLIPPGVQSWYSNVLAVSATYFAYASTMAIHIYSIETRLLVKIIAKHTKTISCIAFCPTDSDKLASCSIDGRHAVWSIATDAEMFCPEISGVPVILDWACVSDIMLLAVAYDNYSVKLWDVKQQSIKKAFNASAEITVMRWHPSVDGQLICGHVDGTMSLFENPKRTKLEPMKTKANAVEDCQWDPNSSNYLLVSYHDGQLHLIDVKSRDPVVVFDRHSQGVKALAWVTNQPGSFLSASDRVGVLKVWNVSQRQPTGQVKVGVGGMAEIKAAPRARPGIFAVSFKNGSVGLLDFNTRKMVFSSLPGHSETIFDIAFNPVDMDVFATASYDGYVKLWRVSTEQSYREIFSGENNLLYSVAYNTTGTMIAAVSSSGFAFVWNDKGEELARHETHRASSVYRCVWHPTQHWLLSGGSDMYAVVINYDKPATPQVKIRFKHPATVIGVQFDHTGDIVATGCHDGIVRFFNLNSEVPFTECKGHTARIFNIAWHPEVRNVIATGSDDKTIRIWDVLNNATARHLKGHENLVRALLWHSECAHILISGSWDATIRVWNVFTETCLHVCTGHQADVYGIASHPMRPFLFISCSRDTSLRFWSCDSLADKFLIKALVSRSKSLETGNLANASCLNWLAYETNVLYGKASKNLAHTLENAHDDGDIVRKFYHLVSFFHYRKGLEDLWALLAACRGDPPQAEFHTSGIIVHENEIIGKHRTAALQLVAEKQTIGTLGRREERLVTAATTLLRIGDIQGYCTYMALANQWEKALCVAPVVSIEYWQKMCSDYLATLSIVSDTDVSAPMYIATEDYDGYVRALLAQQDLGAALLVAKVTADNGYPKVHRSTEHQGDIANGCRSSIGQVAMNMANTYFDAYDPVRASLTMLATSDVDGALHALDKGCEAILLYIVALCTRRPCPLWGIERLAHTLESAGENFTQSAVEIWRLHPRKEKLELFWKRGRRDAVEEQTDDTHPNGDPVRTAESVRVQLHQAFSNPGGFSIDECRRVMEPFEAIPLQTLPTNAIAEILACAAFIGFFDAMQLGFMDIVTPLAQTFRNLVTHQKLDFPVSVSEVTSIEQEYYRLTTILEGGGTIDQQTQWFFKSLQTTGFARKTLVLTSAHLPYRTIGMKESVLTSQIIKGFPVPLSTNHYVSLEEYEYWSRVNIFSPMNTGEKIRRGNIVL